MRKGICILLTALLTAGTAFTALADGGLAHFYDYKEAEDLYGYYFMTEAGIELSMDQEWYQKTRVVAEDTQASFYHKDSYNRYQEEGTTGGLLFTIACSVNNSFEQLPDYEYIGFDEEEAMNYYVCYPTDYQAYTGDEACREEYDRLWATVKDVTSTIHLMDNGQTGDSGSADDGAAAPMLSGGWAIAEDPAITEDVQAVFDLAMEGYGDSGCKAVALLATQVVAGTNYCLLCQAPGEEGEQPCYCMVYIYQDLSGNAEILEVQDIEIGVKGDTGQTVFGAEHKITISKDTEDFMVQECPETAVAGETVTVYTCDVTDADLYVSVDGDTEFGEWAGGGYQFVMPDHDVEISAWAVGNGLA